MAAVSLLKILFPREKLLIKFLPFNISISFTEKSPSGPTMIEFFFEKLILKLDKCVSD